MSRFRENTISNDLHHSDHQKSLTRPCTAKECQIVRERSRSPYHPRTYLPKGNESVTISSSEDEEQETLEEDITSSSGSSSSDFEGFTDTEESQEQQESSEVIQVHTRFKLRMPCKSAKEHDNIDVKDGLRTIKFTGNKETDSERTLYNKTIERNAVTHTRIEKKLSLPPIKRLKQQRDNTVQTHLETSADQIVEISSDSEISPRRQKRSQINNKTPLTTSHKNLTPGNNKCSPESPSEFPATSPSNPQQHMKGGKYASRSSLLKNTLPSDSFERKLATITARRPPMSLKEKIESWRCDMELSDVEDVNAFDDEFKRYEDFKRKQWRQIKRDKRDLGQEYVADLMKYDFTEFRKKMFSALKDKCHTRGGGGGDNSETDTSESVRIMEDKPSTSAVALQQKRINFSQRISQHSPEKLQHRCVKDAAKKSPISTTPPCSSSSSEKSATTPDSRKPYEQTEARNLDRLLRHNSSEGISNHHHRHQLRQLNSCHILSQSRAERKCEMPSAHEYPANTQCKQHMELPKEKKISNPSPMSTETVKSVFKLHELTCEMGKGLPQADNKINDPKGLIQMRLDFSENKRGLHLKEKTQELFKDPTRVQNDFSVCSKSNKSPIKSTVYKDKATSCESSLMHEENERSIGAEYFEEEQPQAFDAQAGNTEHACHQQYEFCNYLGLTGMSTATAVANAMAELAQCNLARRSMRVLRQQQKERQENNQKKDELNLLVLKQKHLKEMKKREKAGEILKRVAFSGEFAEDTCEMLPRDLRSLKEINRNSVIGFNSLSQPSVTIVKNEPEIKILCHISANNKEDAEEKRKAYVKEIAQPLRDSLKRHLEQQKLLLVGSQAEYKECDVTLIKKKSFRADEQADKPKSVADLTEQPSTSRQAAAHALVQNESNENLSSISASASSQSNTSKIQLKLTRSCCNILQEHRSLDRSGEHVKGDENETDGDDGDDDDDDDDNDDDDDETDDEAEESLEKQNMQKLQTLDNTKTNIESVGDGIDNNSTRKNVSKLTSILRTTRAPPPRAPNLPINQQQMHQNIQVALEASRNTKPSIYILHSMDSNTKLKPFKGANIDDKTTNKSQMREVTPVKSIRKIEVLKQMKSPFADNERPTKKIRGLKNKKYKVSSSYKRTNKRNLRKRKVVLIKTMKATENERKKKNSKEKEIEDQKPTKSVKTCVKINDLKSHPCSKAKSPSEQYQSFRKSFTAFNSAQKSGNFHRHANAANDVFEKYLRGGHKINILSHPNLKSKSSAQTFVPGKIGSKNISMKLSNKLKYAKMCLRKAQAQILRTNSKGKQTKSAQNFSKSRNPPTKPVSRKLQDPKSPISNINQISANKQESPKQIKSISQNASQSNSKDKQPENDNVVVSSTTNLYDERPIMSRPIDVRAKSSYVIMGKSPTHTEEKGTQKCGTIRLLNTNANRRLNVMLNPLRMDLGNVLHMYYELDTLIVIQEYMISFWKYSKILNVLCKYMPSELNGKVSPNYSATYNSQNNNLIPSNPAIDTREPTSSLNPEERYKNEWMLLGESPYSTNDAEISTPYANRICIHNSTPVYIEMRGRYLPHNQRICNLITVYINIYYYHEEDMIVKSSSINLDTVQSEINQICYTTITDSRYFVLTWPQENILGKTRTGLCKYSITPQLDTLASIREFKSMRHIISYLECMNDDKLIGFGGTHITIWNHRSGDVLMNYDVAMPMGMNIGSIYYPSHDIEENDMLLLFQYRYPEILVLALKISHVTPSYRLLHTFPLSSTDFTTVTSAINTGDHIVLIDENDREIWINCSNPCQLAYMPAAKGKRFYVRHRAQFIELTNHTLNVDTLANLFLKLAAGLT
uniref:Uncharacterized protein n=1 Tax=Glossina palpalis gambiensis TaxID=67801 RepID=A0A1B0BZ12_9MUSC